MAWQMLYIDASNFIWIGNGICTLCTMKKSQNLQGGVVALHNDSNGESRDAIAKSAIASWIKQHENTGI